MKVENILQAKGWAVETIPPGASMAEAIHRLMSAGVGALVVSDYSRFNRSGPVISADLQRAAPVAPPASR